MVLRVVQGMGQQYNSIIDGSKEWRHLWKRKSLNPITPGTGSQILLGPSPPASSTGLDYHSLSQHSPLLGPKLSQSPLSSLTVLVATTIVAATDSDVSQTLQAS
jgi:hypothetical protein